MSREIEEMAEVYERARLKARDTLGSMNEGEGMWYSKAFYEAGYRKQVEGEWMLVEKEAFWISNMKESLETGKPTKELMPVCSCCKRMFGKIALEHKFCPNCGAKMKGENDGHRS